MKPPIQENDTQIVVDKVQVESLTKRFLAAAKLFFQTVATPSQWKRIGLENTWRVFFAVLVVLGCVIAHYLSFLIAYATLIITAIWLWRSSKK